MINYYVNEQSPKSSNKSYPSFNSKLLKNIPVKDSENDFKLKIIKLGETMLMLNQDVKEQTQKFQRSLQRKFEGLEINKKLENWYELSFAEFIKELGKKKIKLSLSEEAEWEDYFLQEQQKAVTLKNEIDATDKEIDQMVYALYGLTEEEIEIVEKS
ncbi:MAG: hypothetical protein ACOVLC_06230 [Flavobacterium sp.]